MLLSSAEFVKKFSKRINLVNIRSNKYTFHTEYRFHIFTIVNFLGIVRLQANVTSKTSVAI
jgi:hypothetical protein